MDGIHQAIPARDMSHELCPHDQTKLWGKEMIVFKKLQAQVIKLS